MTEENKENKERKFIIVMMIALIVLFIIGIIVRWEYISGEITETWLRMFSR